MSDVSLFQAITLLDNVLSLQGRAHRDQQLVLLKDHLEKYYRSRNRKWIVLFPEGGFLRKRRETSQAFAKKNNLPFLKHVTLPRVGATQVILKTLVAPQENGTPPGGDAVRKGKGHCLGIKQIKCQRLELKKTLCRIGVFKYQILCINVFIMSFSSADFIFDVETRKRTTLVLILFSLWYGCMNAWLGSRGG